MKRQNDNNVYKNDDMQTAIRLSLKEYNKKNNEMINTILKSEPISTVDSTMRIALQKLNPFQRDILAECIQKKSGGLSLPLGSGKTLISLVLSLYLTRVS